MIIPTPKIDLILLEEPPKIIEHGKPKEDIKEEPVVVDPKAKKVQPVAKK